MDSESLSVNWPLSTVSALSFSTEWEFRQELFLFEIRLVCLSFDTDFVDFGHRILTQKFVSKEPIDAVKQSSDFWPFDTKMPITLCWKFWFVPN